MVIPDRALRLLQFARVSDRIPKLSPQAFDLTRFRKFLKPALGATMILSSLLIGALAYDSSRKDALRDWERAYLPSRTVLDYAFQAYGYAPEKDAAAAERILRSLPGRIEENSFFVSSGGHWVVILRNPDSERDASVYSHSGVSDPASKTGPAWTPLGVGWLGFQKALERAAEAEERSRASRPRGVLHAGDPMMLQY